MSGPVTRFEPAFSPLFIGVTVVTEEVFIVSRFVKSFSPLFIGVTVVTNLRSLAGNCLMIFQSPFHRGNGCNTPFFSVCGAGLIFQSPFHRGNGCNKARMLNPVALAITFSPLFIGVTVVTPSHGGVTSVLFCNGRHAENQDFQSPFHRGNGCNRRVMPIDTSVKVFQSPFHRGNGCNSGFQNWQGRYSIAFSPLFIGVTVVTRDRIDLSVYVLSVPFSSG